MAEKIIHIDVKEWLEQGRLRRILNPPVTPQQKVEEFRLMMSPFNEAMTKMGMGDPRKDKE